MARRLDPPHDRVILTPDELLVIGLLERSLAEEAVSPPSAPFAAPERTRSRPPDRGSSQWLRRSRRLVGWLLVLGVTLTIIGVVSATGLVAPGVCLIVLGLTALFELRFSPALQSRRGRLIPPE
jgi:hypothetical protein